MSDKIYRVVPIETRHIQYLDPRGWREKVDAEKNLGFSVFRRNKLMGCYGIYPTKAHGKVRDTVYIMMVPDARKYAGRIVGYSRDFINNVIDKKYSIIYAQVDLDIPRSEYFAEYWGFEPTGRINGRLKEYKRYGTNFNGTCRRWWSRCGRWIRVHWLDRIRCIWGGWCKS